MSLNASARCGTGTRTEVVGTSGSGSASSTVRNEQASSAATGGCHTGASGVEVSIDTFGSNSAGSGENVTNVSGGVRAA